MDTAAFVERTLTDLDHTRLVKLTGRMRTGAASGDADNMADALDAARLVPSRAVAPDVVTMYSQVLLKDCATGRRFGVTLCYPADAEPSAGFVSVMSPVGASVLGMHVGETARWVTPNGEAGAAEVAELVFQPEASGDYTL
ncbi:MAG: GreA/GreB family elongation factor [Caldimonas sp.]